MAYCREQVFGSELCIKMHCILQCSPLNTQLWIENLIESGFLKKRKETKGYVTLHLRQPQATVEAHLDQVRWSCLKQPSVTHTNTNLPQAHASHAVPRSHSEQLCGSVVAAVATGDIPTGTTANLGVGGCHIHLVLHRSQGKKNTKRETMKK